MAQKRARVVTASRDLQDPLILAGGRAGIVVARVAVVAFLDARVHEAIAAHGDHAAGALVRVVDVAPSSHPSPVERKPSPQTQLGPLSLTLPSQSSSVAAASQSSVPGGTWPMQPPAGLPFMHCCVPPLHWPIFRVPDGPS